MQRIVRSSLQRLQSSLAHATPLSKRASGLHHRSSVQCRAILEPLSSTSFGRSLRRLTGAAPTPAPQAPDTVDSETLSSLEEHLGPLCASPVVPAPKPVVIIISGPSGVGKDAVVAQLKEAREDLYFVVTATSRPRRPAEVEGRDYFFVDKSKFEEWISTDMLLEHALVYGEYKGIPRQQVDDALKAGTDVVLRIDVQGAATVKRLMPDAISIFITAESERSLVSRLAARKTESLDRLKVRAETARAENARINEFDYVVVNGTGKLEECVSQVSSIIDAEKARVATRLAQSTQAAPLAA